MSYENRPRIDGDEKEKTLPTSARTVKRWTWKLESNVDSHQLRLFYWLSKENDVSSD